mmetsp:Transcript_18030/g.68360  ORF Transcript_18030/g.68360 Transcript_18030/m.68360 type:complete len:297 (-) Transcript_18030:9-899(-)
MHVLRGGVIDRIHHQAGVLLERYGTILLHQVSELRALMQHESDRCVSSDAHCAVRSELSRRVDGQRAQRSLPGGICAFQSARGSAGRARLATCSRVLLRRPRIPPRALVAPLVRCGGRSLEVPRVCLVHPVDGQRPQQKHGDETGAAEPARAAAEQRVLVSPARSARPRRRSPVPGALKHLRTSPKRPGQGRDGRRTRLQIRRARGHVTPRRVLRAPLLDAAPRWPHRLTARVHGGARLCKISRVFRRRPQLSAKNQLVSPERTPLRCAAHSLFSLVAEMGAAQYASVDEAARKRA